MTVPLVGSLPLQLPEAVHAVTLLELQVMREVPPEATLLGDAVMVTVGVVAARAPMGEAASATKAATTMRPLTRTGPQEVFMRLVYDMPSHLQPRSGWQRRHGACLNNNPAKPSQPRPYVSEGKKFIASARASTWRSSSAIRPDPRRRYDERAPILLNEVQPLRLRRAQPQQPAQLKPIRASDEWSVI